jgi:hypothetical protein
MLATNLLLGYAMMLQDLDNNQRVCSTVVLDDIDVCIQTKHFLEGVLEGLLVEPVSIFSDAVYEGAVHICAY